MKVETELSQKQVQELANILKSCRYDSLSDAVSVLVELAVNSWIDWLSGDARYTSLTEQYTEWIEQIYTYILSEDEPPSVDRLYNSLNIPFGQAQYITRVLSNKTLTHWRSKAIEQLKSVMDNKINEVDEWIENDEPYLRAEIVIDKLSYLELKSICDRLFRLHASEMMPPNYNSRGGLYQVQIPAVTFRLIYDELQ